MFTANKNFMDSIRQVTETNLKLQQDLLLGWTRMWPGFTGRPATEEKGVNRLQSQWSDGVLRIAEAQRELIGQQYDAALAVLDVVMAMGRRRFDGQR